jgi:3-oxoacyl-(acyl-carrier-protein) synthase
VPEEKDLNHDPLPPHKITGLGTLSALGIGLDQTKQNLFYPHQHTTVIDPSEARYLKLKVHQDWLKQFDLPENTFLPNLLALIATQEALNTAGIDARQLRNQRVGICLGSTAGCTNYQEAWVQEYFLKKLPQPDHLYTFFTNNSALFVKRFLGVSGPVQLLNNACTSGADALGVSGLWLDEDVCDIVICGGTDVILPGMHDGFRSMMLLSPELCRPFDLRRQGLTLGEGAGILIMERSTSHRGAFAQILGYGCGTDAYHPTSPQPEARGLNLAVNMAMSKRQIAPEAIDFINAHATGTPHNDLAEGKWIQKNLPAARVVATKGYTGHTLGAAGAIEAILTILSLEAGVLPRAQGFSAVDPEIGLTPVNALTSGTFDTAISLSLGFGGINSAVILGRPV